MKNTFSITLLVFCILLGACASAPGVDHLMGPALEREAWNQPSQINRDLVNLPLPKGKIVASIYSFRDLTGQYKPSPSSSFSTAVSQGASSMLVKSVKDSGWFSALSREGLQDLLTERKIIRAGLKNKKVKAEVPALLGANIIFEGGIIGYETNMKTGGAGAKYFGVGISEQYRVDQVTVNLRAVDVSSGRVINSVTVSRSILSRQVQAGAFRFIRFKRLLEVEAGYTRNEPVQLCLLEAIQEAVVRIIVEGVEDSSWSLRHSQQTSHPLLAKYGRGLGLKKSMPYNDQTKNSPNANQKKIINKNSKQVDSIVMSNRKKMVNDSLANKSMPRGKVLSKQKKIHNLSADAGTSVVREKGGKWVIQLMSSESSKKLFEFADENQLKRSMYEYIYYQLKGKDRFAIIYGRFHKKTQALKAIESLPPKLRLFEPWVRAMH